MTKAQAAPLAELEKQLRTLEIFSSTSEAQAALLEVQELKLQEE